MHPVMVNFLKRTGTKDEFLPLHGGKMEIESIKNKNLVNQQQQG
jgi:hypothetical protein